MTWYLADGDPFDDAAFEIDLDAQLSEHDRDSVPTTFGHEYVPMNAVAGCQGVVDSSPCRAEESALDIAKLSNGVDIAPISPTIMPTMIKTEDTDEAALGEAADDTATPEQFIPDPALRPLVQKCVSGKIRRAKSKAMTQKLELRKRLKREEQEKSHVLPPAMRAKLRSRNEAAVSRCFKLSLSDNLLSELYDAVQENVLLRERVDCLESIVRDGRDTCQVGL
jgi:hypothetical protein